MRWLMLVLLVLLPLQWFVVLGPLRLHIVGMLLVLLATLVTLRLRALVPVASLCAPFVAANAALCVVWVASCLYHATGVRQPVQQVVYLMTFLAIGALTARMLAEDRGVAEVLRWAATITSLSVLVALSGSMMVNGVNPAAVFAQTIASGDPEVLQQELFRTAFSGFGFEDDVVKGNIRHEVFGAVLVGMTVSAAAVHLRPFSSRLARRGYQASMVLGTTLLVVSLSRSILIAAAVWPLLSVVRSFAAARIPPRLVAGLLLGMLATAALGLSGGLTVLWVRFTQDTSSYEARDTLLQEAYENIASHALTGGVGTDSASSHNFVLDTWLRAGAFGAAAALVAVVCLLVLFGSLAATLHREPSWMLPVTAMLALPLVRIFTAGGGLIPPVSWVGLGLAAGFLLHRRALRADDPSAPTPERVTEVQR